ncbi:MAG: insulinase family protein [Bacteroidetes bacterium]|nr:insulinase family protein [Bacteroidota bacterium]MBU2556332.1 insulinase family protein [Bacteroidota bacterium]
MKKAGIILLGFLLSINLIHAQHLEPNNKIPIDPTVKIGQLENGLVYYIRHNTMPENRVEMRLVTNAGSILEDDDQQGLAHFVEHMCFNGTKNFNKNELINFLEKSGVRFGADLNAYTSFDETVYMLQLPTDRQGLIDSAFMVLKDWAHQVSFDPNEIDKERGVIREEWRMGLGADDRMRKAYFPVIFNNSRYAERLPIGLIDIIDTAHYERFTTFYKDWYRPNLQAVIVVGDIDIQMAEEKIISHFSPIKNPENPKERVKYDIEGNKEPLIAIATDKEATRSTVMMFYKHPKKETLTIGDYKEKLVQQLYSYMISNRLREISQKPTSPFIYASTFYGGFLGRASDAYSSYAGAKENQLEESLEVLISENERVKRYGFTPTELERVKKELLNKLEQQAKEKDKTPSSSFVRDYTSHFLENEPIPGIENELIMAQELIPQISVQEINSKAIDWITEENMVVVITAPDKEDVNVPNEKQILEVIQKSKNAELTAWVDSFKDEPLLDKNLKGSKTSTQHTDEKLGITSLELENGIKVILKPTDFKNDEILMSAYGWGGTSLFDDEDAFAASSIARVIAASGMGNFSKSDLEKKLSGINASVQVYIDDIQQGLNGNASPEDFETLLQLVYLHFEGARHDQQAFDAYISQQQNQFKFMRSNPQMVFYDTLYKLATSNSPRFTMIPTDKQLQGLEADKIYAMYDQLFGTADGFTFVFVGNIDVDTIKPYLEKYLGSLNTSSEAHKWINRSPAFPDGITDVEVFAGAEHKSMVALMMKAPFEWSAANRLHLAQMMKVLSIKLRENLREDQGGVYGVGARQSNSKYPESDYTITINWGTNPEMVDTLTNAVFFEMNRLINEGPTPEDVAKVRETSIRERETNEKQNRFWLNSIKFAEQFEIPLINFEEFRDKIQAVTAEEIQQAAREYLKTDHYLRLVLKPEAMRPDGDAASN